MNYQRLQQLDKEKLIKLILEKQAELILVEKRLDGLERLGRLCIDGKGYWIYRGKTVNI